MPFAWGQAKIQVWESLMSQELVILGVDFNLLYLDSNRFYLIFGTILLQLHIIIFQEWICEKIDSCGKRKGFRLDSRRKGSKLIFGAENIKIRCKNIQAKKVSSPLPTPEAWHGPCHHRHDCARCKTPFCCFFQSGGTRVEDKYALIHHHKY